MFNFMRKLKSFMGLHLFYGFFLFSMTWWVVHKIKFHGVENWPKVPAIILESRESSVPYRRETFTGSQSTSLNVSYVKFEYVVDGQVYESGLGTPDGGGLPSRPIIIGFSDKPWNESWDAFYKPSSPDLAVLSPVPYEGGTWLIIALVTGIPMVAHLSCKIFDFIQKWRESKTT